MSLLKIAFEKLPEDSKARDQFHSFIYLKHFALWFVFFDSLRRHSEFNNIHPSSFKIHTVSRAGGGIKGVAGGCGGGGGLGGGEGG